MWSRVDPLRRIRSYANWLRGVRMRDVELMGSRLVGPVLDFRGKNALADA
jgi:hypothetical protein